MDAQWPIEGAGEDREPVLIDSRSCTARIVHTSGVSTFKLNVTSQELADNSVEQAVRKAFIARLGAEVELTVVDADSRVDR
jgi:hypothetical protein